MTSNQLSSHAHIRRETRQQRGGGESYGHIAAAITINRLSHSAQQLAEEQPFPLSPYGMGSLSSSLPSILSHCGLNGLDSIVYASCPNRFHSTLSPGNRLQDEMRGAHSAIDSLCLGEDTSSMRSLKVDNNLIFILLKPATTDKGQHRVKWLLVVRKACLN